MFRLLGGSCVLFQLALLCLVPSSASAFEVKGTFIIADDKNELSGLDCLEESSPEGRLCMVVDDEASFAQFATLSEDLLTAEKGTIELFKTEPEFGKQPDVQFGKVSLACTGGVKKNGGADGEAIAHAGRIFYVVGSHGCGRKNKKYSAQSFVLSRIEIGPDGSVVALDSTYRLSEAIATNAKLAAAFGHDLPVEGMTPDAAAGTSIEAMTVLGTSLAIGFRSPATDRAYLLLVPIAQLFSPDGEFSSETVRVATFDFGPHVGFRDIEALPKDGSIVALIGPEGKPKPDGPYELRLISADLVLDTKARAKVPIPSDGSPEAIEVLDGTQVLVISDGAVQGGAQLVKLKSNK